MSEKQQDDVLTRSLAVTLNPLNASSTSDPPIIYLEEVAQELREEATDASAVLYIHKDILERVLMGRLMLDLPDYPQWPVFYLLGCYERASVEYRKLSSSANPKDVVIAEALLFCKKLIVSYVGLSLLHDMFPSPRKAQIRGSLQLLDSMDKFENSPPVPGDDPVEGNPVAMPYGFIEQFSTEYEEEGLQEIIEPIVNHVVSRVLLLSILGDFMIPLKYICQLASFKASAKCLVKAKAWLPSPARLSYGGDGIEISSILGPFFSISAIPSKKPVRPDVRAQCFANVVSRRDGDVMSTLQGLRLQLNQLWGALHSTTMPLLRNQATRGAMLDFYSSAIESNNARAKMRIDEDVDRIASHGFFINLSAVLIKACGPFLDPRAAKAWDKIDVRYIVDSSSRASFKGATKIGMTEEEEKQYAERVMSERGASPSEYHFVCECFFLTAKGCHLGVVCAMQENMELMREQQEMQRFLQENEAGLARVGGGGPEAQAQLARIRAENAKIQETGMCWAAVMNDEKLLQDVLSFYRFMAAWMLRLAGQIGSVSLPLLGPSSLDFRSLPEYFVEDITEVLLWAVNMVPSALSSVPMEEFMMFCIAFLGSPAYIKNPYLRSKLVEVLHLMMPEDPTNPNPRRRGQTGAQLSMLFEGHPAVQAHMVEALINLYVDIEHTDRHNAFYEKFNTRHHIGELLGYLWTLPAHRESWKKVAGREGGRGLYLSFCNMLTNDAIYLLDESLKVLPEVREIETLMADAEAWGRLSRNEQADKLRNLTNLGRTLKSDLYLAAVVLSTIKSSTGEITSSWLLPEMVERIAVMLNYFLLHLTGSERKSLKIKDPAKYGWKPSEVLAQIASIYVHLARADSRGVFAKAIAADKRSYRQEQFMETREVLSRLNVMEREDFELEVLGQHVAAASAMLAVEDAEDEEAPDEFKDPLTDEIMGDPVTPTVSPADRYTYDRPSIMRHLLNAKTCPFTNTPLSKDDFRSNTELKARIDAWKEEKLRGRAGMQID